MSNTPANTLLVCTQLAACSANAVCKDCFNNGNDTALAAEIDTFDTKCTVASFRTFLGGAYMSTAACKTEAAKSGTTGCLLPYNNTVLQRLFFAYKCYLKSTCLCLRATSDFIQRREAPGVFYFVSYSILSRTAEQPLH
jgi:hypothetical protein